MIYLKRALLMALLALYATAAMADCVLYKGRFGFDAIARMDGDLIYKNRFSYTVLAHVSDNVLYKGRYSYEALSHTDSDVIYEGRYSFSAIAHVDDDLVYKDRFSFEVLGHTDGCTKAQTLAIGAIAALSDSALASRAVDPKSVETDERMSRRVPPPSPDSNPVDARSRDEEKAAK